MTDGRDDGSAAATFCATLVDEWVAQGLTDAVICPGSRSTPMALALADRADLAVHVQLDERSAAFMALGLGMASGHPAVVLCTSGTAAVEFHPAVVEADLAAVPILVVTADRPPELQGVGAPQTIGQTNLYGASVRWFVEPGPPSDAHADNWRQLAADAHAATLGMRPGPVHLNLAFREPLLGQVGDVPVRHDAALLRPPPPELAILVERLGVLVGFDGRPGLIVAGVRAAVNDADAEAILNLSRYMDWPILADPSSGCRVPDPMVITASDAILRHSAMGELLRPAVVLRIGGLLASRVTNEWLARSGAVQLGIDRYGCCPDPDRVLTAVIYATPAGAANDIVRAVTAARAPKSSVDNDAATRVAGNWRAAEAAARAAIDAVLAAHPESEPAIVARALASVPDGGSLVVSSSMPIRDLEWYSPPRRGVRVYANRGANGIDGVVSTAVGVALTGRPTTLVIGDLAFLHDTNGMLGLARRAVELRIEVIDNDGGGIFSFLPQRDQLSDERFEQLFGTPQTVDLAALAGAHGVGDLVTVHHSKRDANRDLHAELNAAVLAVLGDPFPAVLADPFPVG